VRRVLLAVAASACVVATGGGCGDDGGSGAAAGSGCESERREALDPASSVHVLSGPEPQYTSDPPTSGPHEPAPILSGVRDEPLPRPNQVGHLEAGGVLLQYGPDLDPAELADLEGLAGEGVVVVPNEDLPAPVVATAWLVKQSCATVDTAAIGRFVDDHLGGGPGSDG
jgi:Protein of unknown function (DUF3105)